MSDISVLLATVLGSDNDNFLDREIRRRKLGERQNNGDDIVMMVVLLMMMMTEIELKQHVK